MLTVDRIRFAETLARGAKVLDIGGQKMANCDPTSPFAQQYARIEQAAADYRIVDYQRQPTVDYCIDFNKRESIAQIDLVINDFRPSVILCMETLEHINYHHELMNSMAGAVASCGSLVFITVPNNGNWVFNALGWNHDHSIGFFRDIALRFVTRSDLGKHEVLIAPCMQKYLWYWRIAYALAFLQPFSWGFLIAPQGYQPAPETSPVVEAMREYTSRCVGAKRL